MSGKGREKKDVVNERERLSLVVVTMIFYVVTPADSVHM